MKNILAIILFCAFLCGVESCLRCRNGQEYTSCGSRCTADCDDTDPECRFDFCLPKCECPGRQVWHDGQCTDPEECPPRCPRGQIFNECGSDCNKTCDIPEPFCNRRCVARCECPPGQVFDRLDSARCIQIDECPVRCPGVQVFNECGSQCEKTCDDPFPVCPEICVARCECPQGSVLNWAGECVPLEQCPALCGADASPLVDDNGEQYLCGFEPTAGPCPDESTCVSHPLDAFSACCPVDCPRGQVFNQCGSACNATCDDLSPTCTEQCVPRCECPVGQVFNVSGQCVDEIECPAVCGPGISPVEDANGVPVFCGRGVDRQDCPADTTCVIHPADRFAVCCPDPIPVNPCPEDQVYNDCGAPCNATCADRNPICATVCVARCECPRGMLFNALGQCVQPDMCPDDNDDE